MSKHTPGPWEFTQSAIVGPDEIAEGFGGGVGGRARTQAIAAITKATGANHE